jgi:hypothetical protein
VGVFSPLRAAYRRAISAISIFTDSSPIGKAHILRCYARARKEGITRKNIMAAWKGAGLWPVNSAKALMSGLLLKPLILPPVPGSQALGPSTEVIEGQLLQPVTPPRILPRVVVVTPNGAGQLYAAIRQYISPRTRKAPAARLLFRKLGESIDEKNTTIANLKYENQALKLQLEAAMPSKRQKVEVQDPNRRFATIDDIVKSQENAKERVAAVATEDYDFHDMCFEWQIDN